jgi:ATP-dependent Clp protease adaptor protein ClpS
MIPPADIRCATAPVRPRQPRVAPHQPRVQPLTAPPALEPPWHVILLDDDFHTFEYVIEMLHAILGHSRELAKRMADEVNEKGRVIVATVHKELAELRQQQIEEFGPDPQENTPQGQVSMKALIECSE